MPRLRTAFFFALLGLVPACPQATTPSPTRVDSKAAAVVDDPRAVNATGDYYAADGRGTPVTPPPPVSPGTGRPDETNGVCRLYAPELTDPECCDHQLGFDVAAVKRACGFKLYLGESFHSTCGYHFLADAVADGASMAWFRLSAIHGETPKQSAEQHQAYTRTLTQDSSFTTRPIPGIEGAYWSELDGLHWAWLPGWSVVRQFTWNAGHCSPEGMLTLLQALVAAPEIAAGTGRVGLIPVADPPPVIVPDPGPAASAAEPPAP